MDIILIKMPLCGFPEHNNDFFWGGLLSLTNIIYKSYLGNTIMFRKNTGFRARVLHELAAHQILSHKCKEKNVCFALNGGKF